MKKRASLILAALLALCLSACGSAQVNAFQTEKSSGANAPSVGESFDADMSAPEPPQDNGGFAQEGSTGSSGGTYYENTKIIRTASLRLQTTDFDTAAAALDALTAANEGYIESSDLSYGGYYSGGSRWGEYTIRVPQEKFDSFLFAAGDVAHVVSRNSGKQDVGQPYYDAELHLKTLETKHERLLELLEKAELMEDILTLESALSDVEYQIQQYSSTLKRYDDLIGFSTINVTLQEVTRVTETPTEADSVSVRIAAAFASGWQNFCDGMADFAVWLAYNFMGVLIFLAVAALVILLLVRLARRGAWRKQRTAVHIPSEPESKDKKE